MCTFQPYQKEYEELKKSYEEDMQKFYDSFTKKELDDYSQKWSEYYMSKRKYKELMAKRAARKQSNIDKPRKVSRFC